MREDTRKKLFIFFVGFFVTATSVLPTIGGTSPEMTDYTNVVQRDGVAISVQSTQDTTTLHYTLGAFQMTPVKINDRTYVQVTLGKEASSLSAGAPDLPSISRSIIIPDAATMGIRVLSASYVEYKNIYVTPSKGNLVRTVNPQDVPYEFGTLYTQNTWYPPEIAELQESYYLRDFRGQVVTIHPFQYNPVEATLRYYNDITVEISGVSPIKSNNHEGMPIKVDSDFLPIYEDHFLNFQTTRYTPISEQGNMLIITYDAFYNAMVPFLQWKTLKGIPTEMVNVSTIGNANAIKAYIAQYYNTKGLTFVLLVGDAAQVPSLYASGGPSDPSYGYIVGNDHYPDLFVGRFSAENIAQVQTQVNRTVTYERDPIAGAAWYKNGTGIGSQYGTGDDGEYDYEHIANIRTLLLNFTYVYVDGFYGQYNPTQAMVAAALNAGRSIINYCGHGSPTSWGTTGFSNSDVNALTNDNKLPFIVSVACNNGEFDDMTCFGEAWLRATHNGKPTGAIGAYMSSISQSWNPPMEAQDEFNYLLVGHYANNSKTTFGGLCYNGAMSMNDKYGSGGWEMTDTWIVFGDPSVQVRTNTPATMTVNHGSLIIPGSQTFDVDVPGVSNALCAISYQGRLLGNGYTNKTGRAVIQFYSPVNVSGSATLVVTAFNKMPYNDTIPIGQPNHPPAKPQTPTGANKGKPGTTYLYSTRTTDPDGDSVFYLWDWGDGNVSDWTGPYASGQTANAQKSWKAKGNYSIKVKAKDSKGAESNWSDPLSITMPYTLPLIERFGNLIQLFPRLFHFFEMLLKNLRA